LEEESGLNPIQKQDNQGIKHILNTYSQKYNSFTDNKVPYKVPLKVNKMRICKKAS